MLASLLYGNNLNKVFFACLTLSGIIFALVQLISFNSEKFSQPLAGGPLLIFSCYPFMVLQGPRLFVVYGFYPVDLPSLGALESSSGSLNLTSK